MQDDILRVLITREQISTRCEELAGEITAAYSGGGSDLHVVAVLSGSFMFLADLIRLVPVPMKLALIGVSSYPGRQTASKATTVLGHLPDDLAGEDVLVVDDILDSGKTLRAVVELVRWQGPASLRTCVLLRKPSKAPADVPADFVGFDVADRFVVGYGLDYDQRYRNYPHIGVLKPELY